MSEVSIIEFIVYGIVGYSGIILLIASAFKDNPSSKSQSVIRSIWLIASIICIYMLSSAGATISFDTVESTLVNVNTTETWTETVDRKVTLVQPVWVTLHYLFFIMLVIYFMWNMLQLFVKRE